MPSPAPRPATTAPRPGIASIPRWKLVAGLVALLLLAGLIWYFPTAKAQAEAGSAYAARVGCSCRYVQGRAIGSCKRDFEPGMEIVSVEDLPDDRAVRGYVPLLASRTARFAGASGCLLDPE